MGDQIPILLCLVIAKGQGSFPKTANIRKSKSAKIRYLSAEAHIDPTYHHARVQVTLSNLTPSQ